MKLHIFNFIYLTLLVFTLNAQEDAPFTNRNAAESYDFIESRDPIILDVRTPGEYSQGHIQDSILIPVQVLESNIAGLEEFKDREILVYCRSGNRSVTASLILEAYGFQSVSNMSGGINGWLREGFPVEN